MHMFINKFKEQPSSVRKRCLHICPRKRSSVPRAFRNTQCPRTNIRTCILAKWKILRLLPFNNIFETRRTKYVYHNNWYGLLSVFSSATTAKSSLKLNSVVNNITGYNPSNNFVHNWSKRIYPKGYSPIKNPTFTTINYR